MNPLLDKIMDILKGAGNDPQALGNALQALKTYMREKVNEKHNCVCDLNTMLESALKRHRDIKDKRLKEEHYALISSLINDFMRSSMKYAESVFDPGVDVRGAMTPREIRKAHGMDMPQREGPCD